MLLGTRRSKTGSDELNNFSSVTLEGNRRLHFTEWHLAVPCTLQCDPYLEASVDTNTKTENQKPGSQEIRQAACHIQEIPGFGSGGRTQENILSLCTSP